MPDRNHHHRLEEVSSLGRALRALPLLTPEINGWSNLAEEVQRRTIRSHKNEPFKLTRRYALLTFAAALALFALAPAIVYSPMLTVERAAPSDLTMNGTIEELQQLYAQSQSLEQWLRDTQATATPLSTQDLLATIELEDLIGLIDVQLATPSPNREELPLWRQRVALLQDLAVLRYSQYRFAENQPVASRTSARPAMWTN